VVASTAGALPEVLADAAVLVAPGDRDELAGALARVLADPVEAAGLVERGHLRAERFSWDDTAAAIADLYRRLAR
jgi:glycosyltransferase involved in cell wall biosynthesis